MSDQKMMPAYSAEEKRAMELEAQAKRMQETINYQAETIRDLEMRLHAIGLLTARRAEG